MSQNPGIPLNSEFDPSATTCANCGTPMPSGLRFCRNCGFRLGEGSAEYTETVRFKDGQAGVGTTQMPFGVNYAAPLTNTSGGVVGKRRKRLSGMSWMFIGLLVFFLAAAAFTAIVTPIRRGGGPAISIPDRPRAFLGVDRIRRRAKVVSLSTTLSLRVHQPTSPDWWVATSSPRLTVTLLRTKIK